MPKTTYLIQRRRTRQARQRRNGRSLLRTLGLLFLTLAIAGFFVVLVGVVGVTAVYSQATQELPSYEQLFATAAPDPDQGSTIYAGRSQNDPQPVPIYHLRPPAPQADHWLSRAEIPDSVVNTTFAAYQQAPPPFGPGWQRLYTLLLRQTPAQDHSYLLHHLVSRELLAEAPADNPLTRLRALLLSHRAAQNFTLDQLVEWHLNRAYYGNLALGIDAAAHVYFGRPATQLTLGEASLLAPVPLQPAANPIDNLPAARARQAELLEGMVAADLIGSAEATVVTAVPIPIRPPLDGRFDIIAPHFARLVQQQLEQQFGPHQLLSGQLQIYTTLDLSWQQQAECLSRAQVNRLAGSVGDGLAADERDRCAALAYLPPLDRGNLGRDQQVNEAAVIMLDPRDGRIRALVGGLSYWQSGAANLAVDVAHLPGTALAPFIYLTALSQGYTAASMVLDVETDFGAMLGGSSFVPQNVNGRFQGPIRMRQAVAGGDFVPAVRVLSWVGVERTLRTAHNLGLTTMDQHSSRYGLSLPLSGGEATLLDMAYAYGILGHMGLMVGQPRPDDRPDYRGLDPVLIERVEARDGTILYGYAPQQREILTPQLAFVLNDMLADRSARCATWGCPNLLELPLNRPAAATVGTTTDYRGAWTVGYTPELVTAVWVGNRDHRPTTGVTGMDGAAPIWHGLMSWALQTEPIGLWPRPAGLVETAVCDISGLLPTPHCPTVSELFIAGTQPTLRDTIFQEIAINRETGRRATVYTPPELIERRVYRLYPKAAAEWAAANGLETPPTDYDTILPASVPEEIATITSPTDFAAIGGTITITGTAQGDQFSHYRLAYFRGLTPGNLQTIVENVTTPRYQEALAEWDVSNLSGLYTLLLTVVAEDGRFTEVSTHVTIDNTAPTVQISFPQPGQTLTADSAHLTFSAEAEDNLRLARVDFYLDGSNEPFASSLEPTYQVRWRVRGSGCHTVHAKAVDGAGNVGESSAVSFCVENNGLGN
jgi:membrane carboxypeptidase/penicillin-binding protein